MGFSLGVFVVFVFAFKNIFFSLKRHFPSKGRSRDQIPPPVPLSPPPSPPPRVDKLNVLSITVSPPHWLAMGAADQSAAPRGGPGAGFPRGGGKGAAFGAKRERGGGGSRDRIASRGQPGSPRLSSALTASPSSGSSGGSSGGGGIRPRAAGRMAAPAGGLEDAELREAQRDYLDFLDDEVRRAGRRGCCVPCVPPGVGEHLIRVSMSPAPCIPGDWGASHPCVPSPHVYSRSPGTPGPCSRPSPLIHAPGNWELPDPSPLCTPGGWEPLVPVSPHSYPALGST